MSGITEEAISQRRFPIGFLKDMESIAAVNGTTTILTCQLNQSLAAEEVVKVSWLKMPRQLLARGKMKITTNERITVIPQAAENVFQLRFDPVTREDAGEYRCVYNYEGGVTYQVLVVNIQVRPSVSIDPSGELELLEGEYAFVVCNASGTPFPQFRWWVLPLSLYRNQNDMQNSRSTEGKPLTASFPPQKVNNFNALSFLSQGMQSGNQLNPIPLHEIAIKYRQSIFLRGGKLIINAVNRDMTGWYFCEAHNSIQPSAIEQTLLTIHYKPQVFLPQREVFFGPSGNVNLVCEFQAFPEAEVEWHLEGRILDAPPCEELKYRPPPWCTERSVKGPPTGSESKNGFSDTLNFPDLIIKASKKEDFDEHFQSVNLTQPKHDLSHYDRWVRSVLNIWVNDPKQFGRYSCKMKNRYGVAEGFILLRNKGNFKFEPFGYTDTPIKTKEVIPMLLSDPLFQRQSMLKLRENRQTDAAFSKRMPAFFVVLSVLLNLWNLLFGHVRF